MIRHPQTSYTHADVFHANLQPEGFNRWVDELLAKHGGQVYVEQITGDRWEAYYGAERVGTYTYALGGMFSQKATEINEK